MEVVASEPAAATCLLLELGHDELSIVTHELCDPLKPLLAVHLSSTAKGMRELMEEQLAELKQQRQDARSLAALLDKDCSTLAEVIELYLGTAWKKPPTLAHWRTLGNLVACRSMPELRTFIVCGSDVDEEGVISFAAGLRRGGLPKLRHLQIDEAQIGTRGASALAAAITKLPKLRLLALGVNAIGDAGLVALAPAVRQHALLEALLIWDNQIGDRGVAALLAEPRNLVAPLQHVDLEDNAVTNAGCAALVEAMRSGALPLLDRLHLKGNPASEQALRGPAHELAALVATRLTARMRVSGPQQ